MKTFSILTVCSGNICRSPLAEQLLRAGLDPLPQVSVASAGTIGLTGQPMPEEAAALSRGHGGDPSRHSARQLTERHLNEADLVFAMSREHRRAIAQLSPRVIRRTFTIREFARLTSGVTESDLNEAAALPLHDVAGRFATLVTLAASRRSVVAPPLSGDEDDVIDPFRGSAEIYAESFRQLAPTVDAVVSLFRAAATATQQ